MAKKKAEPTEFGKRLRAKREEAGMTLTELAEAVGVQWTAIRRLETSPSANPTAATLRSLAEALDCLSSDLLGY